MAAKNLGLKRATSSVKRYVSYKELDLVKTPSQYFDSLRVKRGEINYQGITYSLKKIPLTSDINIEDLPEVQIIRKDYKNPYLINYIDYILEEEEKDTGWTKIALYIILEYSDFDLKTYVIKMGGTSLSQDHLLQLMQTLVGGNYLLMRDLDMAHGDLRPQNIRVIKNKTKKDELEFKLSYLDDILGENNSLGKSKADICAYFAPELLSAPEIAQKYQNEFSYMPSKELENLIQECPDELNYDPYRADVFSTGLILLSAATGTFFSLINKMPAEGFRDGTNEIKNINEALKKVKQVYDCKGIVVVIRLMLNQNPLQRYDFEELAIRTNKLRSDNNRLLPEIKIVAEEPALLEEYELIKQNYIELTEIVDDLKDKELEYINTINSLKKELEKKQQMKPISNPNDLDISGIPLTVEDSFFSNAYTEVGRFVNPVTVTEQPKKVEEEKKVEKKVLPNLSKKDKNSINQEAKESVLSGKKF